MVGAEAPERGEYTSGQRAAEPFRTVPDDRHRKSREKRSDAGLQAV